ncbi:MAG TPA: DUF1761 domain-containing protein [Caulobacteraceae bacterium]|nr:DUF1761 domain-containing protein [Caulobacteraceae bacterium]
MKQINWLGLVVALVISQGLGVLWYGQLFGELWKAAVKVNMDASVPISMTAGAVDNLVVLVGLAWLIPTLDWQGWAGGAKAGLAAALFFAVPAAILDPIYAGAPASLMAVEGGYLLIYMVIGGAVIGGLRLPSKAAAAA